jgi:transposase
VLCLDEIGPLGTDTYRGWRWSPSGQRPHVAPDYGGRGKLWSFGALEPKTGQATIRVSEERKIPDFVLFLDHVVTVWPQGNLILLLDNLNVHKAQDVLLWALAHPRVSFFFLPTYSPWLNLIEPWWKTLRSLALRGNYFERPADMALALYQATDYWNDHRKPYLWRKVA